jgi:glyoxylase-like metal-dependent hydrolase (beta-lactamase superfamily II)
MEVAKGIHRIETPFGPRVNAMYLLVGSEAALLVDTTTNDTAGEHLGGYLDRIGLDASRLRYVLNTHSDYDHTAGNGAVRALAPNAVFMCHELDRPMIEDIERMIDRRYCEFAADHGFDETEEAKQQIRAVTRTIPIDLGLTGGEVVDLGGWRVTVLHTPGHTWGSISVFDPRSRALVIGDAVLWNAVLTATGDPAFPPTYRYVDTYAATIHRLQGMDVDTLLTSHYPVQRGDGVREFLAESRAFVDRTEAALRAELAGAGRPLTLRELADALGPRLGAWPSAASSALSFPLSGHLERLAGYGLVDAVRAHGKIVYAWQG